MADTQQTLQPGIHTFGDILTKAGIEIDDSYDRRRIKVGGLGFDSVEETLRVPETADTLIVELDGADHTTFTVK